MDGMQADLDGIRAAGELANRQADHVRNIEDYAHQVCTAAGAWGGFSVLNLFQGVYESAFNSVADGLGRALEHSRRTAENFHRCASTYEEADRGSYDFFNALAGGAGWDIGRYRPAGSGNGSIGVGARINVGGPDGEDPGSFTDARSVAQTGARALMGAGTKGVEWDARRGQYMFPRPGASAAAPSGWDRLDRGLSVAGNPVGTARSDLVGNADVSGRFGEGPSRLSANSHAAANTAVGAYGTAQTVHSWASDPDQLGGLKPAYDQYQEAAQVNDRASAMAQESGPPPFAYGSGS